MLYVVGVDPVKEPFTPLEQNNKAFYRDERVRCQFTIVCSQLSPYGKRCASWIKQNQFPMFGKDAKDVICQ